MSKDEKRIKELEDRVRELEEQRRPLPVVVHHPKIEHVTHDPLEILRGCPEVFSKYS